MFSEVRNFIAKHLHHINTHTSPTAPHIYKGCSDTPSSARKTGASAWRPTGALSPAVRRDWDSELPLLRHLPVRNHPRIDSAVQRIGLGW